jgi:cytidyltransferase-like protein
MITPYLNSNQTAPFRGDFGSQNAFWVPSRAKRIGVIHGRFQPFHIGHAEYLMLAKAECDQIIIGVTNPCPALSSENTFDTNRGKDQNNPLAYFDRELIIRAAMTDLGINTENYTIVPFPIGCPNQIQFFAPNTATYYITVFDNWGRNKVEVLKKLGLNVKVIYDKSEAEKNISATMIRTRIAKGEAWEHLVLPSVARVMKANALDYKIATAMSADSIL